MDRHILLDDFGWGEVGYHNVSDEVSTPRIDALARSGIELNRFYAHKICSPTRSAILTGRSPIHVNVQNVAPEVINTDDPEAGFQGIPRSMTGIAEVMRSGGYKTHLVGKWDAGMATTDHTPWARGFDSWFGYWHHSNDYWTQNVGSCDKNSVRDLWRHNASGDGLSGPAIDVAPADKCGEVYAAAGGDDCVYEEDLFSARTVEIVQEHDLTTPLFL